MANRVYKHDIPADLDLGKSVAIDTETQGLSLVRDKLCLVQLSSGDDNAHLVQVDRDTFDCPNLKTLLSDDDVEKIFHFGRFDLAVLMRDLGVDIKNVYCTKIASGLIRTYTDAHGLKSLCKELLNVDLSKQQQSSDWANENLKKDQIDYAASDVLYLHRLKRILSARLQRENRMELAQTCFDFLPTRASLDLGGWADVDIFSHSFRN